MRLQKKSLSKIALVDLLRRRRLTLERFLEDTGIVSYELLVERCTSLGVSAPDKKTFEKAAGRNEVPTLSSPAEGIVIIQSPTVDVQDDETEETIQPSHKKKRSKKFDR